MNDIIDAINRLNENSWMDYVQLGATVVGIIISALAVFYAVKVPKKIAEEQNSIALFEKRYEFFSVFRKCVSFASTLKEDATASTVKSMFWVLFSDNDMQQVDLEVLVPLQMRVMDTLKQGYFLFDFETKQYIEPLVKQIPEILLVIDDVPLGGKMKKFKKVAKKADDTLSKKLEETLQLSLK